RSNSGLSDRSRSKYRRTSQIAKPFDGSVLFRAARLPGITVKRMFLFFLRSQMGSGLHNSRLKHGNYPLSPQNLVERSLLMGSTALSSRTLLRPQSSMHSHIALSIRRF